MSPTRKTTRYTLKPTLGNMTLGTAEELGRFPSGIHDNGEVSLNRMFSSPRQGSTTLDLFIERTKKVPMQVDMILTIEQLSVGPIRLTQSSKDWQEPVFFNNVRLQHMYKCTITLEITWSLPAVVVSPKPLLSTFLDLSEFALSPTLSDVTIVIGDEKIFTHKMILGAASPVLLSAMTSPMKEAADNCIVIEDIEADVMKAALKFFYTGKHEAFDDFEMAMKVLVVAEKYEMEKFKALIEKKLIKCITLDNALEILNHADTYRAETLRKECMEFIIDHSKEVVETEYFDKIIVQNPFLMKEFVLGVIERGPFISMPSEDDYESDEDDTPYGFYY